MHPVKTVTKKIKNNPLPVIAATAGVIVGAVITHKMDTAHAYTVGKWVDDLAKQGFTIFVADTATADKTIRAMME
jgi:Na+/H+ antiporter NhaA